MAWMRAAGSMPRASAVHGLPEPTTALKDPGFKASCIARLAQSAERKALNLVVVGSSPTVGVFGFLPTYQKMILDMACIFGY